MSSGVWNSTRRSTTQVPVLREHGGWAARSTQGLLAKHVPERIERRKAGGSRGRTHIPAHTSTTAETERQTQAGKSTSRSPEPQAEGSGVPRTRREKAVERGAEGGGGRKGPHSLWTVPLTVEGRQNDGRQTHLGQRRPLQQTHAGRTGHVSGLRKGRKLRKGWV